MGKQKVKPADHKVTIKIPGSLYNRVSEIVAGSGFNSVTDFIVYVLRDLVSTKQERQALGSPESSLTKEEILAIRRRLKALGYL